LEKDLYEILGASKDADEKEIKKAYRQLVKKYHPDNAPKEKKEGYDNKMKEINAAYAVLSDEKKRAKYDNGGFENLNGRDFEGFGFDIRDIFGDLFGNSNFGFHGGQRRARMRGSDIHVTLQRDLSQSWKQEKRTVNFTRNISCDACGGSGAEETEVCDACNGSGFTQVRSNMGGIVLNQTTNCSHCNGSGKKIIKECSQCNGSGIIKTQESAEVEIPKGATYHTIVLEGMGNNEHNSIPGNLLVQLQPDMPEGYNLINGHNASNELMYSLTIPLSLALMGGETKLKHPTGHEIKMKVPQGVQFNDIRRLSEQGLPELRGDGNGDLIIEFNFEIPQNLTDEQKEVVEKMKNIGL
jgi:molecular chaperone DnaJ